MAFESDQARELYQEAYWEFYYASLDDGTAEAQFREEPVRFQHGRVEAVTENFASEILAESHIELIDRAKSDAGKDVSDELAFAEATINEVVNEALVNELTDAWQIDNSEHDGSRRYAVNEARTRMSHMGFGKSLINACTTQACVIATDGAVKRGKDLWPKDQQ